LTGKGVQVVLRKKELSAGRGTHVDGFGILLVLVDPL
jgi:hypothetical protein